MKLGYFTLTDNPPGYGDTRRDPNELINEVLDQCLYAEELGFNSAWVPEHHFSLFGVLPPRRPSCATWRPAPAKSSWRRQPLCSR